MQLLSILSVCGGLLAASLLVPTQDPKTPIGVQNPESGKSIGAAMCKNCHDTEAKGNAYTHWTGTPHAKAYETLAGAKAKEIAKGLGIEDPQKSEKCLKCHVTAYGVDPKLIKGTFKVEHGVQCESCHGPGEMHQKKRLREAMKKDAEPSPITAAETRSERSPAACKQCHNEESPTYEAFCLKERMKTVEHLDPRRERTKEQLEKLRDMCSEDCKTCEDAKKKDGEGKK